MAFEYLLSALPALPAEPGGGVSMAPSKLASLCSEEDAKTAELVRALLMEFDLRAMERIEFGVEPSESAVHTEAQLKERSDMPEWLKDALASERGDGNFSFDGVWRAYYEMLASVARGSGSKFLERWVSWEVGLRNAVARTRATRLGLSAEDVGVEGISEEHPSEYRPAVDALISHMDGGFDAWREMDRSLAMLRLGKARELAPPFTFNLDELLSYIVQFVVLRGSSYLVQ